MMPPLLLTLRISSLQKLIASGCFAGEKAAWKAWKAAEAAGVWVSHWDRIQ